MKGVVSIAAFMTAVMAGTAHAAVITVNQNTGTVYTTDAVTNFQVDGNEMDGMSVTAVVARTDGSTFSLTRAWADNPGAPGNDGFVDFSGFLQDFDLYISGDTFDNGNWELDFGFLLQDYRLLSLSFDGRPGNTVFDRTFGGAEGTTGSNSGKDFAGFGSWGGNITATYSNAVALGVSAPVGDIYTNFLLTFGNGTFAQGLSEALNYTFTLDTDNAVTRVAQTAVPEPGSLILLGTGLATIASRMRRKKA